jgi:hypothetical protein
MHLLSVLMVLAILSLSIGLVVSMLARNGEKIARALLRVPMEGRTPRPPVAANDGSGLVPVLRMAA